MVSEANDNSMTCRSAPDGEGSDHTLLESEEWKDHMGERVIGEYHTKDHKVAKIVCGQMSEAGGGKEEFIVERPGIKGPEAKRQNERPSAKKSIADENREGPITPKKAPIKETPRGAPDKKNKVDEVAKERPKRHFSPKNIDLSTVEVIAYGIFRAFFGKSVRVPLKYEGLMDMDLRVENTDVILNTDNVALELPQLLIWRLVFTYKHRPIIEYGRGIEGGMKIHYTRAILFLLAMWWASRKSRKTKQPGAGTGSD